MTIHSLPENERDCYDELETARDDLREALERLAAAQDAFDQRYGTPQPVDRAEHERKS